MKMMLNVPDDFKEREYNRKIYIGLVNDENEQWRKVIRDMNDKQDYPIFDIQWSVKEEIEDVEYWMTMRPWEALDTSNDIFGVDAIVGNFPEWNMEIRRMEYFFRLIDTYKPVAWAFLHDEDIEQEFAEITADTAVPIPYDTRLKVYNDIYLMTNMTYYEEVPYAKNIRIPIMFTIWKRVRTTHY